MDAKKLLTKQIVTKLLTGEQIAELISDVEDVAMGDFTIPCFKLSKELRKAPAQIAQDVAASILPNSLIEKIQAVNGYVNIFLNRKAFAEMLFEENQIQSKPYAGKTVCIDFSSVNIAKPFHMGHLLTTAIGNALSKMYSYCGAKVVRINHLGDWGTQFGKLIVAYKMWGSKEQIEQGGLRVLNDLYVRFHIEEETSPELIQEARQWFLKIEKGDEEANELFEFFKKITLKEVKEIYQKLDIEFDSWDGESFFNDKMQPALEYLRSKGLTEFSDGAEVVMLGDKMPPCLLVKSDGASLYATRDIAAAIYRKEIYNFDKCLYVVAYQQNLHFQQYFKVLEMAGFDWAKNLIHVAYGVVSLEEGPMSTRKGNTVWLSDVLDRAVEKALSIINDKSPQLENKEKVAEQIGIGAVVFSAVANSKIKDVVFSYDRVLNFEGETSPYLQYTSARTYSVLEKAQYRDGVKADYTVCDSLSCHTVNRLLAKFDSVVCSAAEAYEPSIVSKYLLELAKAFNKMYLEHRIIRDDAAEQNALLDIVNAVNGTLVKGLGLLGISCPKRM